MIHLLTGENTFELERQLKELTAAFEGDEERIDGEELRLEQLPDLLAGATLFSSKRLIIMKNVSANRPVWTVLGEWCEKGIENDVVLVEPKPDKRTKTYKWLEKNGEVVTTKELRPFEAVQWLQKEARDRDLAMSKPVAEFLVDYVGTSQWRLSSELEKLLLDGREVTIERIRELVEPTPQATSFELLDAALSGDRDTMQKLFDDVSRREDPYMFFGLLAGQFQALALMQTAGSESPDKVAKETGVHPFVLRKAAGLAARISRRQLQQLVGRLAELDANMKSRSVEPWTQVHSFLLSLQ